MFADLVGFTTLAESRDAEEVRDLLTRYFETCRSLVGRYGGVIEKFIGDAVMAVWGTPVTNEDDAERAVRAALELTEAVKALGEEVGIPTLRARAGVLTGEAAVALNATNQGMVAGDIVNTASRIQAAAQPGDVLVGDNTMQATQSAIDYEAVGPQEVKGKALPINLWRAVRVVGLVGGTVRASEIEPPFTGRDSELRLTKQLYHATTDERRPHLVSVIGIGGIGKSRLAWEFEKYIDGLAADVWWHRGRCLAYGDGVAFWALAEMVRMRAGIVEDEESATALPKLRATLDENIPDAEERRFVEPRLAQLLGLEARGPGDQENLFSAWRIFFERLADTSPTILLFEDLHWADDALLDFVEYLLDWARDRPIFIVTTARPELLGATTDVGRGEAQLHLALPRAAHQPAARAAARGRGHRAASRAARADPREIRGHPVLRGRDGADAHRPRPARTHRQRLSADSADRDPRRALEPPGADRGAARPPLARGTAGAPGRIRSRTNVHRAGPRGRIGPGRGRGCTGSSPRWCARKCSRCGLTHCRRNGGSSVSSRISFGEWRTT